MNSYILTALPDGSYRVQMLVNGQQVAFTEVNSLESAFDHIRCAERGGAK